MPEAEAATGGPVAWTPQHANELIGSLQSHRIARAVTSERDQRPWDRPGEAAGLQMGEPELEYERAPQRRAVVAAADQMLSGQATHSLPVQEVIEPAIGRRELVDPVAQRPAEPRTEGHRKPQLRVFQGLGRH